MVHVIPFLPCRHSQTKIRRTVNDMCCQPVNVTKLARTRRQKLSLSGYTLGLYVSDSFIALYIHFSCVMLRA